MRPARLLVYSLLPLFAACQVWKPESPSTSVDTRFQGELVKINGALQFRPCTEKRLVSIEDVANTGLRREADSLFDDGAQGLFVDLRGTMGPAKVRGTDGKLEVSRLYRVQNEGPGCDDPNFKLLTFAANGNEPFWSARVNNQGCAWTARNTRPWPCLTSPRNCRTAAPAIPARRTARRSNCGSPRRPAPTA